MKISLKGLSDEQKEKVKTIVTLGQTIGGNEQIDGYLMEQLMNVYLPKTNTIDELASLYELTGDERVRDDLLNEYYSSKGISPEQRATKNIYSQRFSQEYPLEDEEYGNENARLGALVQQYPELLTQYYGGTPEPERFKWGNVAGGIGAGAAAGAGIGSIVPVLGTGLGAGIGGAVGGLGGLVTAISDKNTENDKEKRARLNKLVNQYKVNIPSN